MSALNAERPSLISDTMSASDPEVEGGVITITNIAEGEGLIMKAGV